MAKQQELSCDDILKQLRNKEYAPIYLLMGEEDYYIDLISDYITDNVLTDTEKEFNQMVMYGADVTINNVIDAAKRYPMMADRQVIVVKEAQMLESLDNLEFYAKKPSPSTILVFCYKHGTLDRRKTLAAAIAKVGVVFESKPLKDTQIPGFITSHMKKKGLDVEPKAAAMMAEFVGTDLSRLIGELDKLALVIPAGSRRVTPDLIEENIGISKNYNNFELRNAIVQRDVLKANTIVNYFERNPKSNPIQMTLALLFNFFSNLMLAYYAPNKSEQGVAEWLELKSAWAARDYLAAMRQYSGVKTMSIIGEIRRADAMSKGVDCKDLSDGEILRELIFKILH